MVEKVRRINGMKFTEGKEYVVRAYFTGEKFVKLSATDNSTSTRVQLRLYFENNDAIVRVRDGMTEDKNAPILSYIVDQNRIVEGSWRKESTFVFALKIEKLCDTTDEFLTMNNG